METWLASRLLTGTLQGAVVVTLVWLTCRRFRGIPAPVQAGLWWLASLKLLVAFLPLPPVALPLLPAPDLPPAASLVLTDVARRVSPETSVWLWIVVTCWAIGLLAQAIRLALAFRRLRGIFGRATPLSDTDRAAAGDLAHGVGLRRCPEVRVSDEIPGPLVSGIVRPVVLLPATLPHADWRIAICHEFVHVRRHDLVLGWVPALAERLFFFHPLARLAAREYVTAREAACDAGVLRVLGVPAGDYARLLVNLGIAQAGPLPAAGGAPTSKSSLRRRLDMLNHPFVHGRNRHTWWLLTAALVLALVPFELSARQSPAPGAAPAAPAIVAPVAPAAPVPEPRPVTRAAPGSQAARPVTRGERSPGSSTPDHRAILEQLKAADEQLRHLEAASTEEHRKAVQDFNALAEAASRLSRATEEELRHRRATTEAVLQQRDTLAMQIEQLRRQQEELTLHLRILAEEQKQLAETSKQLMQETERIGNAVSPRK